MFCVTIKMSKNVFEEKSNKNPWDLGHQGLEQEKNVQARLDEIHLKKILVVSLMPFWLYYPEKKAAILKYF